MNENAEDTLAQKVMKRVEELKLWRLKYDKSGFESVYEDVLSEIEKMPESSGKYSLLADVLLRGSWWIPGKASKELVAAIRDAAEKGRNEDVMRFALDHEYDRSMETDPIQYIRESQIPRLEAAGFTKALGYMWYKLGRTLQWADDHEACIAAYQKAREILTPADLYYAFALSMEWLVWDFSQIGKETDNRSYQFHAHGTEYRYIDGELRFWEQPSEQGEGWIRGESALPAIWRNACACGKRFFFDAKKVGEFITDERGIKLTYGGSGHTVVTPAGTFVECVLWITDKQNGRIETYYKAGVGIVRQDTIQIIRTVYLLSEYGLAGGSGLLPVCAGNRWRYVCDRDPRYFTGLSSVEITHADSDSVITANYFRLQRHGFNPDSWLDMALAVRCEFAKENHDRTDRLVDVRPQMARMKALAKTPYEIAHTKATCNVMERILSAWDLNPDRTEDAVWNYFRTERVKKHDNKIYLENDEIFEFWWAWTHLSTDAICCGDCYEILQDGLDAVWHDGLAEEQECVVRVWKFGRLNENDLKVTKAGTVVTPAGSFRNCLKLSLNITGVNRGWYEKGEKEYYFAPGVGIVKMVCHFEKEPDAIYELCEYAGIGEGYFPAEDGFRRFYRATNLPESDRASVEYTFVRGEDGELYMLTDQTGMRPRGKELNRRNLYGF